MAISALLDSALITSLLDAGGWSATADDTVKPELLPESVVCDIVRKYEANPTDPSAQAGAGMLTLTLGIGRWGILWTSLNPPHDPDGRQWKGSGAVGSGKHLMSYTIGGIGLPHLDTGSAIEFFTKLGKRVPAAKADLDRIVPGFVYDSIRNEGGKRWDMLTTRTLEGLRRRDMQEWIFDYWLRNYWQPAYTAVMSEEHGSIQEAFVVARIWNTSRGAGEAALAKASGMKSSEARIKAEFKKYNRPEREGTMRRPIEAYEFCRSLIG
ncbi:MAG: hypothetical protein AAB403_16060 [Planctomycetota bacterium]